MKGTAAAAGGTSGTGPRPALAQSAFETPRTHSSPSDFIRRKDLQQTASSAAQLHYFGSPTAAAQFGADSSMVQSPANLTRYQSSPRAAVSSPGASVLPSQPAPPSPMDARGASHLAPFGSYTSMADSQLHSPYEASDGRVCSPGLGWGQLLPGGGAHQGMDTISGALPPGPVDTHRGLLFSDAFRPGLLNVWPAPAAPAAVSGVAGHPMIAGANAAVPSQQALSRAAGVAHGVGHGGMGAAAFEPGRQLFGAVPSPGKPSHAPKVTGSSAAASKRVAGRVGPSAASSPAKRGAPHQGRQHNGHAALAAAGAEAEDGVQSVPKHLRLWAGNSAVKDKLMKLYVSGALQVGSHATPHNQLQVFPVKFLTCASHQHMQHPKVTRIKRGLCPI